MSSMNSKPFCESSRYERLVIVEILMVLYKAKFYPTVNKCLTLFIERDPPTYALPIKKGNISCGYA